MREKLAEVSFLLIKRLCGISGKVMMVDASDEENLPDEVREKFFSSEAHVIERKSSFLWTYVGMFRAVARVLRITKMPHAFILKRREGRLYQLRILPCRSKESWLRLAYCKHPDLDYMIGFNKAFVPPFD
jgi:hypothetical protein